MQIGNLLDLSGKILIGASKSNAKRVGVTGNGVMMGPWVLFVDIVI